MKDNYKAQDLKFCPQSKKEAKQFQERAFELGYEWEDFGKAIKHLNMPVFYLTLSGNIMAGGSYKIFALDSAKQITLEEFLAPQRGEMVEVRDNDNHEWKALEFICDLGYGFDERYVVRDKHHDGIYYHFEQMRPIKNEQESLGMFKAFDETIELLEQAIDGLKKIKP